MSEIDYRHIKERFIKKTFPKINGCVLWVGSKSGSGYGQMQFGKRKEMAHRISYQLFVGPIPKGMSIDHICQVKLCVNYLHLQPMLLRDNILLGSKAQNTNCPHGHPFEGRNLIWNKTSRMCRICKQEKDRASYQRRRFQLILKNAKLGARRRGSD